MGQASQCVVEVLRRIEREAESITESAVADRLRNALRASGQEAQATTEDKSEVFAFLVTPAYKDEETGWGTYYGPRAIFRDESGNVVESPPLTMVGLDSIEYWRNRAEESPHPVLRARYADLAWDLAKHFTGKAPAIGMAYILIDSTLELLKSGRYSNPITAIQRVTRALDVAIRINDFERSGAVRDAVISLERDIAEDDKLGTWGFAFDNLVGNKGASLTSSQEAELVNDLESRLQRAGKSSDQARTTPFAAESAAMRLIEYYRSKADTPNVKRVVLSYGSVLIAAARTTSPLVGHSWLEKVHSLYVSHGLRTEADSLAPAIRDLGTQSLTEMKPISTKVEFPREAVDRYISDLTSGPLDEALSRIAAAFLPDPGKAKEDILSLAKEAPLVSLLSQSVVDRDGRTIARIGSVESDLDGRMLAHIAQEMRINAMFLRLALGKLHADGRLDVASLMQHLYLSPAFQDDRRPLLQAGLSAYVAGDHAGCAHLLIPQIEAALRCILILLGGSEYRPGRNGILQLRLMDEILRDGVLTESLGSSMCDYMRILFTESRGWNLRNNVMHGLFQATDFREEMSDRVLHALLLLASLRIKESQC